MKTNAQFNRIICFFSSLYRIIWGKKHCQFKIIYKTMKTIVIYKIKLFHTFQITVKLFGLIFYYNAKNEKH